MNKYLQGTGKLDNLQIIKFNSNLPEIKPGWFYYDFGDGIKECYLFADSEIIPCSGIEYNVPGYQIGTPIFYTNKIEETLEGFKYVIRNEGDSSKFAIKDEVATLYEDIELDSTYSVIYEKGTSLKIPKKITKSSELVLGEYNDNVTSLHLELVSDFVNKGTHDLKAICYVKNEYDIYVPNKAISLYKVFTTTDADSIFEDGTLKEGYTLLKDTSPYVVEYKISDDFSNSEGVCIFSNISIGFGQEKVFIYAKYENVASNLCWLEEKFLSDKENAFQFDNDKCIWTAQEALTAMGLDKWGNFYTDTTYDYRSIKVPIMNVVSYGASDINYETRIDWKNKNINFLRPPINVYPTGVIGNFLLTREQFEQNEPSGIFNFNDYKHYYNEESDGLNCYAAEQGYFGQIAMTKDEIINNNISVLNPNDEYTIKYNQFITGELNQSLHINTNHEVKFDENENTYVNTSYNKYDVGDFPLQKGTDYDLELVLYPDTQTKATGSFNDMLADNSIDNNTLYVFYYPGKIEDIDTSQLYFRGLATISFIRDREDPTDITIKQDYQIKDLIGGYKLQ